MVLLRFMDLILLIIAIALDEYEEDWSLAKANYPSFNHIRAKEKWNNKIVEDYGIYASPTFYVLDDSHRILGKAKNLVELKELLP